MGCLVLSYQQYAAADPGDSISGGGQILDSTSDAKISFGVWANELAGNIFDGELQVVFHRISTSGLNKSKFHGNEVTRMTFYPPDSNTCNAAMDLVIDGTLDGVSGYSVEFRTGDAGSPGNSKAGELFDTVRVMLFDQGALIYDTKAWGDFLSQSNCVGVSRTGLDRGNITLTVN